MKFTGTGAAEGVAIAQLWHLTTPDLSVERVTGLDPREQRARFAQAKTQADGELAALYASTMERDPEAAMIFDIHRMMLEDLDFIEGVDDLLDQGESAEWAVRETGETLRAMFLAIDDETMRARAADIQDVSNRLVRILKGIEENPMPQEQVILCAQDLLPSQTVRLDKRYVVGCVTRGGSVTSHSVILARSLGIGCIVAMGEQFDRLPRQGLAAMDGAAGELIVDPDPEELTLYREKLARAQEQRDLLAQYAGRPAVTPSGHRCLVCANIGSVVDAQAAKDAGADGVGLFRSEFLYLDSPDFPSEETQFQAYKTVLELFAPAPVVVRTLDLGSDKQAPYFQIPDEENPAMGYRAIRICLAQPEIFRTQLRALLRASGCGNLHIMLPMITSAHQVERTRSLLAELEAELRAQGVEVAPYKLGIMIETPAAAVMSDVLAPMVDFFSVGTNDLTQYTLAADRMNPRVADIFNARDPAVGRMIAMAAKAAHDAGIWIGVCGEAGADVALTDFFMRHKIDELSVSRGSILKVRRAICESEG